MSDIAKYVVASSDFDAKFYKEYGADIDSRKRLFMSDG